ncbi:MAG: phosphoglycerate kinase [Planctomycetes bacterium]|nr:phosphoglycerate kinase [Planctomycetota bacterium]
MSKKSVRDLAVRGRRVLVRADFNVPLDDRQSITDDRRITQFLPTLRHILDNGGRAILMSHLGRPSGKPEEDAKFSLKPVAARIEKLIGKPCRFAKDCVGPAAMEVATALKDGEVALLENLRFHKAEDIIDKAKKNPDGKLTAEQDGKRVEFGKQLAALGDMYVNDAFGTCHRKHVSMYDVPQLMPKGARAIGFLVEKELKYLGQALQSPKRPFVAVLGGAKVSDKIGVIKNLLPKVDKVLIGGAMAYTFWAAQDRGVGKSLCERDKLDLARELLASAGGKLILPVDSVAAAELKAGVATKIVDGELPPELMGLDIGPRTIQAFSAALESAGTIVWNGPMGAFETRPFDAGTIALAKTIAAVTGKGAISIIGGGDSAAAVEQAGLAAKMTHISTGGGASLEFLEGKKFGPVEVIDEG